MEKNAKKPQSFYTSANVYGFWRETIGELNDLGVKR
jgi:hypothetical protein